MCIRFCSVAAIVAATLATTAPLAEAVSLVVNPRTGQASIRNGGAAAVGLDGYLLRASTPVFNPTGWSSLESQGVAGWFEGPAAPNRLADTNLFGSTSLGSGASLPIGAPYTPFTPTAIGQKEPAFDFSYSLDGVGVFPGNVEFSVQNNVVLVVDPNTGSAMLENQSVFDIAIDAYLIRSPAGALSPTGWASLQGSTSGWIAAGGAANRLAEGNLFGSTFLAADGGSLSLGNAINASALSGESDLSLEFHVPGLGTIQGGVSFLPSTIVQLPGDYNADGRVDAADYTVWRDGASPDSSQAGYTLWANNYGATATAAASVGAASVAIPEPTAVVVAISALAAIGCCVRRG